MQRLITTTAEVPLHDASGVFVEKGGALRINRSEGEFDLIAPGSWVAVLGEGSTLDWDSLVKPEPLV